MTAPAGPESSALADGPRDVLAAARRLLDAPWKSLGLLPVGRSDAGVVLESLACALVALEGQPPIAVVGGFATWDGVSAHTPGTVSFTIETRGDVCWVTPPAARDGFDALRVLDLVVPAAVVKFRRVLVDLTGLPGDRAARVGVDAFVVVVKAGRVNTTELLQADARVPAERNTGVLLVE